jgi:ATP-dependent helicase STH1/SNF2
MAPGNVSLPPNLTQQNVQEILQVSLSHYGNAIRVHQFFSPLTHLPMPRLSLLSSLTLSQKYKQMQEQGVRPDDPEFLKAHNLLAAIQRQQAFQKQQRMAQQQAQQQRQQQQMNGATPEAANGSHGKLCH